jgi:hypothetical protein
MAAQPFIGVLPGMSGMSAIFTRPASEVARA